MNDDFLTRFRKSPNPQFAASLYDRINTPLQARTIIRRRLAAGLVAGAFLAVLLLIASPRLAVFAQNIVIFFTPAEQQTFPLPVPEVGQGTMAETAISPEAVPGCEDPSAGLTYACQIAKAEAIVGFDIRQLPADPQGLVFGHADADPAIPGTRLIYTCAGCELVITQTHGVLNSTSQDTNWSEVPPDAVQSVQVGSLPAEYVRGAFVSQDHQSAFWTSDAPVQRLRWQDGEMFFEVSLSGAVQVVEYLDKQALIDLAESLR